MYVIIGCLGGLLYLVLVNAAINRSTGTTFRERLRD